MDEMKEYYKIVTDIWKVFRRHLGTIATITSANDPRWEEIVEDFERIEQEAPEGIRTYAGNMILLHVNELETKWRK